MTLSMRFPHGTFTLGGLVADPASAAAKPVSIMNWVIVTSMSASGNPREDSASAAP